MILLEVLAEHGLSPEYVSSRREIATTCPFCDHAGKLWVNAGTGLWICYRCEERGNLWALLTRGLGLDAFQAGRIIKRLQEDAHVDPLLPTVDPREQQPVLLPAEYHPLAGIDKIYERPYWYYLARRGVNEDLVKRYQIGYCLRGDFIGRVIIPVYTEGELRTFVARSITDREPKVRYPSGSKTSHALFNLDAVEGQEHIILVEGAFDALVRPDTMVAVLGSSLSQYQRLLLHRAGVQRVTVLLDSDGPGLDGALKVAEALYSDRFGVRIAVLPEGQDPASSSGVMIHQAVYERAIEFDPISMSVLRRNLDQLRGSVLL